jgi:hypothetical protein
MTSTVPVACDHSILRNRLCPVLIAQDGIEMIPVEADGAPVLKQARRVRSAVASMVHPSSTAAPVLPGHSGRFPAA